MHHREATGRGARLALELRRHGIPDSPIFVLLSGELLLFCTIGLGQTGIGPLPVAIMIRGYGEQLGRCVGVCIRVRIRGRVGGGLGRFRGGLDSWGR